MSNIHPFERAGLGKAPFRYTGMEDQNIQHGERVLGHVGGCTMLTKKGGTCAYCGTYIVNMYNVTSSDGFRFHVGSECIRKVGDPKMVAEVESDEKVFKKTQKKNRDKATIDAAKIALEKSVEMENLPHPSPYLAKQGKTLADYCRWLFANGGNAGQLKASKIVNLHTTK